MAQETVAWRDDAAAAEEEGETGGMRLRGAVGEEAVVVEGGRGGGEGAVEFDERVRESVCAGV